MVYSAIVSIARMRTAVVRVNVDPEGVLAPAQLGEGIAVLLDLVGEIGAGMVDNNLAAMPADRREVEVLIAADNVDAAKQTAIDLCTKAFNTQPVAGVVTFVSRGTDDDARGVLSAFGLTGEIVRTARRRRLRHRLRDAARRGPRPCPGKPDSHGPRGVAQL